MSEVPIEEQVQAAILAALNVDPGMGGPPEPVWETYRPEGVAIVLTNAVIAVVNPWAEHLIRVAVEAAVEAALNHPEERRRCPD